MKPLAEVTVQYQTREGWHLFTSHQMDGLFVASPDLETAFNDVPVAIERLLKLDHDFDCIVQPKLDFEAFCALTEAHRAAQEAVEKRLEEQRRDAFFFTIGPLGEPYKAALSV